MPTRKASAVWNGSLQEGNGTMHMQSGYEGPYSFGSRFGEAGGTNPEELIAAAHAGCYSMALSATLGGAGYNPTSVKTEAVLTLEREEGGFTIKTILLRTQATIPGIDNDKFQELAEGAKKGCPVSRALAGVDIQLDAKLVG